MHGGAGQEWYMGAGETCYSEGVGVHQNAIWVGEDVDEQHSLGRGMHKRCYANQEGYVYDMLRTVHGVTGMHKGCCAAQGMHSVTMQVNKNGRMQGITCSQVMPCSRGLPGFVKDAWKCLGVYKNCYADWE